MFICSHGFTAILRAVEAALGFGNTLLVLEGWSLHHEVHDLRVARCEGNAESAEFRLRQAAAFNFLPAVSSVGALPQRTSGPTALEVSKGPRIRSQLVAKRMSGSLG